MAKTKRTMALLLALLFFLTSVGTTAYVIWQINSEEPVATGNEIEPTDETADTTETEGPKLQGTKLEGFTPRSEKVAALEKTDLVAGEGAEVKAGDTVTVNYTGALVSDGVIFESSLDSGEPATFPLSGVIKGWTDGVPGMKVGGTRRLVIPSDQAYGESGNSGIPANADLVFDIELIGIGEQ